ncbi:MAG: hypothetical protein LBI01_01050 [Elusimicrobium sp.]|jgi:SpoIID/LytB domain protein|nr:hypothetical protein [Elusimicrobium sp.]
MKKHIIPAAVLAFIFAAAGILKAQAVQSGYERKPDVRLNEERIRKTVFDYKLLPEVAAAAKFCAGADFEKCRAELTAAASSGGSAAAAQAETELAFAYFNRGLTADALTHINKAVALDAENPFAFLAKTWFLVSAGNYKDAKKEADAMFYLTADFEYTASVRLAAAVSDFLSKNRPKAQENFAYIYSTNPYLISLAAYMIGRVSFDIGDERNLKAAGIFAQQALNHDDRNFPAARLFADIKFKQKDFSGAWQYYAMNFTKDTRDAAAAKRLKKLDKKEIKNKTLFVSKLETPIARSYETAGGRQIKISLYARPDKTPAALQSFEIVSEGPLSVQDEKLGEVFKSAPMVAERIIFAPDAASLVIKDRYGNIKFATKRPVTLTPAQGKTMLVKNAKSLNDFEADFSDKELTGVLTVTTGPKGFTLVNTAALEDVLSSMIMGGAEAAGLREEALKALAVAARSYLENFDAVTDNEPGLKYGGVNIQSGPSADAVKATRGVRLANGNLGFYDNCFVYGDGVKNAPSAPDFVYSPSNVFKYLISNPPEDLLSAPSDPTQWAPVKWAYYYDMADVQNRANYFKNIGKITAVEINKTTELGRVESLVFKGAKDSLEVTGAAQMKFILGAGTTRSTLFNIIPLYKGKKLLSLLVIGADSGSGAGMCIAGARGLEAQDKNFKEILKFYFPTAEIKTTDQ